MDPGLRSSLIACAAILAFVATNALMARVLKLPGYRPLNTWRDFFSTTLLNTHYFHAPYSAIKRKGAWRIAIVVSVVAAVASAILAAKLTG